MFCTYLSATYKHKGPQLPKFDKVTQAILKLDTSTHHYLKIDTRHAIEATHHKCLFYLRQTTPHPGDTKINVANMSQVALFWK